MPKYLGENLEYKDMEGVLKPTIHVDEFAAKMGDDDDIIVVSFFLRDKTAAKDLADWFEKGYDFVLDADVSPGELKANRYLVYIEMRRRSSAGRNIQHLLSDLNTLTEFEPADWTMHYEGEDHPWSQDTFDKLVPLSPKQYRERKEESLNEMRAAAGLDVKTQKVVDKDLKQLQSAAGI